MLDGFDLSTLATVTASVIGMVVTGAVTIIVARQRTRVDLGASITAGFKELTDQLQEERNLNVETIKQGKQAVRDLEGMVSELEGVIRRQRRHMVALEDLLQANDIKAPPYE